MSYFTSYFGKSAITDIDYDGIVSFFGTDRAESDSIEFKSFVSKDESDPKKKINKILRSICAFLNSEGGLIVWGSPIGKQEVGKKEKVFTGELSMVEISYEKDAFISKIVDSIIPSPNGILFHRIEKDGKYIYVIEVPKSSYSPHQFENIYYMRMDGQTKPSPHHYIEALMKKVSFPNLVGYLTMEQFYIQGFTLVINFVFYTFNLSKLQNDYDLTVHMLGSCGHYDSHDQKGRGWQWFSPSKVEIVHHGAPTRWEMRIFFNATERQSGKMTLLIDFGARLSPMKSCEYEIDISFNEGIKMEDRIKVIHENILSYELKERIGISEKESIEKTIGRKIQL